MNVKKVLIFLFCILVFISVFLNPVYSELSQNEYFIISYDKSDEKIAQDILQKFSKTVPEINREVGFYDIPVIQLVLTHSKKEFDEYITKGKLPENSIAMAIPALSKIILQNPKILPPHTEFYKVLTHEYLHILLHSIAPKVYLPLWFEEGFVQYYAKEWNINREVQFVTDALKGNVLDLQSYSYHYPEVKKKVDIFYLQSYYTFRYLLKHFDKQKYYQFFDHIQSGQNFETSFTRAFGISVQAFLEAAKKSISSHSVLAILYSGFGLFWIIIPILLLVAYLRKRRYARKLEEKWEEDNSGQDAIDDG
ncbi:MAG: hypothetical protein H8E22_05625 [Candidatus Cloacimonetes bacterium]|nr:hypothetical protein [Candidatus Cloacimonadota bacterium]